IGSRRNAGDAIRVEDLPVQLNLRAEHVRRMWSGVGLIYSSFPTRHPGFVPFDEAQNLCTEYADAMRSYLAATAGRGQEMKKPLFRAATLSVALVIFRYGDVDKASEFWRQVALDGGPRRGDPRKTLHDFLEKSVMRGDTAGGVHVTI